MHRAHVRYATFGKREFWWLFDDVLIDIGKCLTSNHVVVVSARHAPVTLFMGLPAMVAVRCMPTRDTGTSGAQEHHI